MMRNMGEEIGETMTIDHKEELDKLDMDLRDPMLESERQIPVRYQSWWSEELHQAYILVKFWKKKCFFQRRRVEHNVVLDQFEQELFNVDVYQGTPNRTPMGQLRKVAKQKIRANSY